MTLKGLIDANLWSLILNGWKTYREKGLGKGSKDSGNPIMQPYHIVATV